MKTSFYTVLCIAVRLGAVWLAANTLYTVPTQLADILAANREAPLRYELCFDAAALCLAALLWLYPGVLARLAASRSSRESFDTTLRPEDLLGIGLAVLGVWFTVHSLFELTYFGMLVAVFPDYPGAALSGKQRATISAEVVQLALGAGLVLGSRGLAALVHRLRYGKTGDLPQRGDTQGEMRDV